jgi:ribosome-binding protein aMBF1 (putative translation factor)
MPAPMKKRPTKTAELKMIGPVENMEKAIKALTKLGFEDSSDDEVMPWRDAFPDHDEDSEPGICLVGARGKEGVTQKWLSDKTGIPQRHISEMENNKRPIGKKNAQKFAKTLNIDYRVFL